MEIKVIRNPINIKKLADIAVNQFRDMVKAVVDSEREVIAVGGELHADEEALLLELGSNQENLWGINLYVNKNKGEWVEFDSLINIRPSQGNTTRDIASAEIREKIREIVTRLIRR